MRYDGCVGTFSTGPFAHRLLVGGEWADAPDIVLGYSGSRSSIDPFNLVFPGTVTVNYATPASDLRTNNRQLKGYVLETLSFFKNKVIASGGSRGSSRAGLHGPARSGARRIVA